MGTFPPQVLAAVLPASGELVRIAIAPADRPSRARSSPQAWVCEHPPAVSHRVQQLGMADEEPVNPQVRAGQSWERAHPVQ